MPLTMNWHDDEKTIFNNIFTGVVTTEDLYKGNDAIINSARSVDHTIHVVLDTVEVTRFQANMLAAARNLNKRLPENVGLVVLVRGQQSAFLEIIDRVMRPMMERLMKNKRAASSLAEAYSMIEEFRAVKQSR